MATIKISKCYYVLTFLSLLLIFFMYKFEMLAYILGSNGVIVSSLLANISIANNGMYSYCDRKTLANASPQPCLCYADFHGENNNSNPEARNIKCAMTFEPVGRLGNVIGQYIGLMVLSRFNHDRPAFMSPEMGSILSKYFNLSIPVLNEGVYAAIKWTEVKLDYVMKESYKNIDSGLFVKLRGYPYSKTYFQNFVDDIRKEFRLKVEYEIVAQNTLQKIRKLSATKTSDLKSSDANYSDPNSKKKPNFQNFVESAIRKKFRLKRETENSRNLSSANDFQSSESNTRILNFTDSTASTDSVSEILNYSTDIKLSDSTPGISNSSESNLKFPVDLNSSSSSAVVTFVGVHVRRGDYLKFFNSTHPGVLADREYFQRAMSYFRQRYVHPVFVIVSNDMKWCAENIPNESDDVYFAGTGNENDPITDFALLVNCNHTIYTFGTYGFFAALFAGGDVVYFTNFTDNMRSASFYHYDTPLPQWHPIAADQTQLLHNYSANKNS